MSAYTAKKNERESVDRGNDKLASSSLNEFHCTDPKDEVVAPVGRSENQRRLGEEMGGVSGDNCGDSNPTNYGDKHGSLRMASKVVNCRMSPGVEEIDLLKKSMVDGGPIVGGSK